MQRKSNIDLKFTKTMDYEILVCHWNKVNEAMARRITIQCFIHPAIKCAETTQLKSNNWQSQWTMKYKSMAKRSRRVLGGYVLEKYYACFTFTGLHLRLRSSCLLEGYAKDSNYARFHTSSYHRCRETTTLT